MKKKLFGIAAATAVAGLCLGVTGSASAEDGFLCNTTESAPFYAGMNSGGGTSYLFTLSPGRGFRASGVGRDDAYEREWIQGHAPSTSTARAGCSGTTPTADRTHKTQRESRT